MIHKKDLKNKHVYFLDKESKFRTEKVVRISGNTVTVKNVLGRRMRVQAEKIFGVYHYNVLRDIQWGRR